MPFLHPGNFPNREIETESILFPALAGVLFTASTTWEDLATKTT